MATKVGINGFGRIGRQVLKAIRDMYPNELEVVAFNDIGDMKTMAHLLKYDSNYGRFNGTVEVADDGLVIDGVKVRAFKETDPAQDPVGRPGRRYRHRVHRPVHHQGRWREQEGQDGQGRSQPHQGRRQEGHHLRSRRRRRPDHRVGRQRGQV